MTRYDPDIIAALAEGRLDPDEAARVEREIASRPAAFQALEAQRAALAALAAAPAPQLTDLERSGMHAAIAEAIGLVEPEPVAARAPRRVPWGSLGIAAAALAGLVAVVPVVGLLNTGGDDAADVALAPAATSSSLADLEEAIAGETRQAEADTAAVVTDDGTFDLGAEAPGDDPAAFGSSSTLPATSTAPAAADETTTTAAVAESTSTTIAVPDPETQALIDQLIALREDLAAVEDVASEAAEENLCWMEDTELRGEELGERWTFEYDHGEAVVVVYFLYDTEGMPGPFKVYGTPDCEEIVEVP